MHCKNRFLELIPGLTVNFRLKHSTAGLFNFILRQNMIQYDAFQCVLTHTDLNLHKREGSKASKVTSV
jgi:hypothetical protein